MKSKLTLFLVLVLALNACVLPQVPATEPVEPAATPETSPAASFEVEEN